MKNIKTPHPRWMVHSRQMGYRLFGLWILIAAIGLLWLPMIVGCRGGDERRSRSVARSTDPEQTTDPSDLEEPSIDENSQDPSDPQDTDPANAMTHDPSSNGDTTEAQDDEPGPPRSEDVTLWKRKDFAAAKIEGDPKLADAIAFLDEKHRGDENAADILFDLLKLDEPPAEGTEANTENTVAEPGREESGGRGRGMGRAMEIQGGGRRDMMRGGREEYNSYGGRGEYGGYGGNMNTGKIQIEPDLAAEVIAVLGRNNTAKARQHLHTLLTGSVTTPLRPDELFSEVVLAMTANPHPQHEDILFVLATEPEKIIQESNDPENYTSFTIDQVRENIQQILSERASIELRTRLAKYLEDDRVFADVAERLEGWLSEEDNRNLPAQILLFQNRLTSETVKSQLQTRLVSGSRATLGYLMGIEDVEFGSGGGGRGYGGYGRGRSGGGEEIYGRGGRDRYAPPGRSRRGLGYEFRSGRFLEIAPKLYDPKSAVPYQQVFDNRPTRPQRPTRDEQPTRGERPYRDDSMDQGPAFDPKLVYGQFATLLWTDQVAERIGTQLLDAETLDEYPEDLKLLSTIPTAQARSKIADLADDYRDYPSAFSTAGMFGQNLTDPSFLLTAKEIYHDNKPRRSNRHRGGSSRGAPSGPRGGRDLGGYGGREGRGGSGFENDSEAEASEWQRLVEQYILALCEQLTDAESPWTEESKPAAAPETDGESGTEDNETLSGPLAAMDIPLHRGAEISDEYHLRWPADAVERLPGVKIDPLEVHYVRMEQEERPSRLLGAYRRHVGSAKIHELEDGVWIDSLEKNNKTGNQRSVDIRIINEYSSDRDLRATESRSMIVEILVVEIPGEELESAPEDSETTAEKPAAEEASDETDPEQEGS